MWLRRHVIRKEQRPLTPGMRWFANQYSTVPCACHESGIPDARCVGCVAREWAERAKNRTGD